MVDIASSIGIKASMDTSDVERGKTKINSMFDTIVRKGKETNVFFDRAKGLLGGMIKLAGAFGGVMIGAITGLVAASPQFKAFLAGLKAPWLRLTLFFGQTFLPLLTAIGTKFKEFVDVVTTNEKVKDFFDKWVTKISEFIGNISKEDMKNFMEWTVDIVDKTLEFTFDVAGDLKDFLFGEDNKSGLVGFLADTYGGIKRSLGIDLDAKTETLAALSILGFLAGHPYIGAALGFAAAASATGGRNIQTTPEEFGTGPLTRALTGITAAGFREAQKFGPAGEAAFAAGGPGFAFAVLLPILTGIEAALEKMGAGIMLTVVDKTGAGITATSVTPNAELQVT